jgi:hypothetical protein
MKLFEEYIIFGNASVIQLDNYYDSRTGKLSQQNSRVVG